MYPLVKCKFFDEHGKAIDGGCLNRSCSFVHPSDKDWGIANPSHYYRKKKDRMRPERERDTGERRGRERERSRDSRDFARPRDGPPKSPSLRSPHKDDVFDRAGSSRWRTSPPRSASFSDAGSESSMRASRRRIDSPPPLSRRSVNGKEPDTQSNRAWGSSKDKDSGSFVKDSGWGPSKDSSWGAAKDSSWGTSKDNGWGASEDNGWETSKNGGWGTSKDSGRGSSKDSGWGNHKSGGWSASEDNGWGKLKDSSWGSKGKEKEGDSGGSNGWGTDQSGRGNPGWSTSSGWGISEEKEKTVSSGSHASPPRPPSTTFTSVPPRKTSMTSAERNSLPPKPTSKSVSSPSPFLPPAIPSSASIISSSDTATLPSPHDQATAPPANPAKLASTALSVEPAETKIAFPFKRKEPPSGPSSHKADLPRTASQALVHDSKTSATRLREPSPAVTERTTVSTSSSRKSLKSKRVRKILTLFDHAVKSEVQRRTTAQKYERWKKIQESPQYARIRLNGQWKLDNVRGQLKKRRDRLFEKFKSDMASMVELLKGSPPPSPPSSSALTNADIDDLILRVRSTLVELDQYILNLKHTCEEQEKTNQSAKETVEIEEVRAHEVAMALSSNDSALPVQGQSQELSLEELRMRIEELEEKSYEIMDIQLEEQSLEVAQLFNKERKQEEDLKEIQRRNAQLKKIVCFSLSFPAFGIMTQFTAGR
ncbi:hypothetical protein GYMLUDRAFT_286548 [Collybiopsis luxurians FD-317 M1]|nr:hypothetical protein GYMLUDRAFT_286548 [Collybiopsis luxurians FD-317 M1]